MASRVRAFLNSIRSVFTTPPGSQQVDVLQNQIGAFGKYQFYLCIVVFCVKFFVAYHQMAIIFLAPKVTYECSDARSTAEAVCPCANPTYNRSIFLDTIVMRWHLICQRKWMISFSQTLFQLGTLLGSVFYGMASDRFGRKKPLLVSVCVTVAGGIIAAFVDEYWTFSMIRLLIGTAVGGMMVITFVLIMEYVGAQYRDIVSALYQAPFNIGHMLLPLFSYYFRDYHHLQLVISAPAALLLSYFVLVPESARWLVAVRRTDEAVTILTRVAKVNKLPTESVRSEVEAFQVANLANQLKKGNIVDLFRYPKMRKNIICMSINWLSCSYCFYGVSQYVGQLSGNVFVNVATSASLALLGTLMSIPLMKIMGRRSILIFQNFVAAGCLILLAISPEGPFSVLFAIIGVMASFIVFVIVYLHCGEIFPTVVRNAAVGFSSMMARVGSMVAPFVIDSQDVAKWLPPVLFAIAPFIAGCMAFLLPETKGRKLLTTIEETEQRIER